MATERRWTNQLNSFDCQKYYRQNTIQCHLAKAKNMLTPSIVSCGPLPKMLNFKFMVSMRLLYLRSSLFLIFSLCAFFSVTAQQAPTIVEVVPQDGAIDVPRNLNFQLTFSENMTHAGLESSVFRLTDRDIEYRNWELGNYRSGINSFCHKMSGNTVFFVS